jgi:hypothetical protein
MRKKLLILSAALTVALTAPAVAQEQTYVNPAGPAVTGAVVGTVAGVGLYNGWWGHSATVAAFPTSAAGAAAAGGVIGIGTAVMLDAALEPCRGFAALFGANKDHCVNGVYVDRPVRMYRR